MFRLDDALSFRKDYSPPSSPPSRHFSLAAVAAVESAPEEVAIGRSSLDTGRARGRDRAGWREGRRRRRRETAATATGARAMRGRARPEARAGKAEAEELKR